MLPHEGFSVPASPFMRALLHYYKVELHHLAPNAISQATIFMTVCEGYLGMEPQWNLWLHLFRAELFAKKVGERGVRRMVHDQYILAQLISSNNGWHDG
jgi:hypothetical protein